MVNMNMQCAAMLAISMLVFLSAGCSHNRTSPQAPATSSAGASAPPPTSVIEQHMAMKHQQMIAAQALAKKH